MTTAHSEKSVTAVTPIYCENSVIGFVPTHLKTSFEATLSDFKKRLTPKELNDFEFTTLEDVKKEIGRIQKEQDAFKTMMNMSRIQSFLEGMNELSKIVEVFLNASNFVAFIWGPLKFLLQVASTWSDSFDILLDAYEQIGEEIPMLEQYNAIFQHDPHMLKILGFIYKDILDFHRRAIRFFSGRVWRQVFRSVWSDFKTRFNSILESLRRHKELIRSKAAALHYEQYQHDSQETMRHIQQYEQDREIMIEKLEILEAAESSRKYNEVIEWIAGAPTHLDHEAFCAAREDYKGSGDWILKQEKVQNWREEDIPVSSILWLNGIPGAGKTILASVIIEKCLKEARFATGYFYCKDGDPDMNNCISVFKSLLGQLLTQYRDPVPYCYDRKSSSGELTLNSTHLTTQILDLFCQKIPKLYIIIDGLDECDTSERKQILTFFNKIVNRCDAYEPGKLRVLFISQDYNDIAKALSTAGIISLKPKDNENDIKGFVNKWAKKIQGKFELEDDLTGKIKLSTCEKAQGMFLFAKLVMLNLHAQTSREQLMFEIAESRFPKGLKEAYQRIMVRIKQNATSAEWEIAKKLLGWMVCARRPLKWQEIQGAVSIEPNEQTINFDDRKLRVHIRDLCGSLVQVLPGDRVELVHSTAKLYITSTEYVRQEIVECNLTALCLQYLTFECFDKDLEEDRLRKFALDGYFAFQDYAVAKWFHHFRAVTEHGKILCPGDREAAAAMGEKAVQETEVALAEVNEAIDDFICRYEEILEEDPVGDSKYACEPFRECSFYDNLLAMWSHIYRHQTGGFEARNGVGIKALGEVLTRNRKLIEELTSSSTSYSEKRQDLSTFYGEKRFKCPKITCFYFHEGFKDAKSRDTHINRHDRPFNCTAPDCSVAEFGFASGKDLEKHMRSFHPEISDQANSFAKAVAAPSKTPWACSMCDKKFTRGFHLRSHIRNHNGERPFACSECGKAFTRSNDCRRHEKLHSKR